MVEFDPNSLKREKGEIQRFLNGLWLVYPDIAVPESVVKTSIKEKDTPETTTKSWLSYADDAKFYNNVFI